MASVTAVVTVLIPVAARAATVTITSGPSGVVASDTANFAFASSGSSSFECAIDDALPTPCTSPVNLTGLGEGNHKFTVADTVAGGSATRLWYVDQPGDWDAVALPSVSRRGALVAQLSGGDVLLVGGKIGQCCAWTDEYSAERFDPVGNSWWGAGTPLVASQNALALVPTSGDDALLLGSTGCATPLAKTYDGASDTWATASAPPLVAEYAAILPNGNVVATGLGSDCSTPKVAVYSVSGDSWTSSPSPGSVDPDKLGSATLLSTGKLLWVQTQATARIFDSVTSSWSTAPSVGDSTIHLKEPVPLAGGKALVMADEVGDANHQGATALVLDPSAQTWSPAGRLYVPGAAGLAEEGRIGAVTKLADGRVLNLYPMGNDPTLQHGAMVWDGTLGGWVFPPAFPLNPDPYLSVVTLASGDVLALGLAPVDDLPIAVRYTPTALADTTGPIVRSYTFIPAAHQTVGDVHWFSGSATINWVVADPYMKVDPTAPPTAVSTPGVGSYSPTVQDASGNPAQTNLTVQVGIDNTPPTLSGFWFSPNPVLVGTTTGWLSMSASDGGSGLCRGEFVGGNDPGAGKVTDDWVTFTKGSASETATSLASEIPFNASNFRKLRDLTVGSYSIKGRVVDCAGNWSSTTQTDLVVSSSQQGYTQSLPPGGNVSTPATGIEPVGAAVTSPTGGSVSILMGGDPGTAPIGYQFVGQHFQISAPDATVDEPLVLTFLIRPEQLPPGAEPAVSRDGVLVAPCSGAPGTADPAPCQDGPAVLDGNGYLVVTILSDHASAWDLGLPDSTFSFAFSGFSVPIDRPKTFNVASVRKGKIPVPFSLGADYGLDVFKEAPSTKKVRCPASMKADAIESYTSATAITYASGTYTYPLAQSKSWIGTCRSLSLTFRDGTVAQALFSFKK